MDDLRTRIAAVVAAHRDQCGDCSCGWESWEESWDMHLADAVIAELDAELLAGCKRGESLMYPDPSITVTTLNLPVGG